MAVKLAAVICTLVLAKLCVGSVSVSYIDHIIGKDHVVRHLDSRRDDRFPAAAAATAAAAAAADDDKFYAVDALLNFLMASKYNIPTALSDNVSPQCKNDSVLYMEQLAYQSVVRTHNSWALKMFESTSLLPQGLHGDGFRNRHSYGLFDECLSIRSADDGDKTAFRGKYCTVYFRPVPAVLEKVGGLQQQPARDAKTFIEMIEQWGVFKVEMAVAQLADTEYTDSVVSRSSGYCLPSSCTAQDVRQAVADLIGVFAVADRLRNGTFVSVETATGENQCYAHTDEPVRLDGASYMVLAVLVSIGLVVVAATIHELVRIGAGQPVDDDNKDPLAVRTLHCFSALSNMRAVLSTDRSCSGEMSCLHGIRFLTAIWVVVSHTCTASAYRNVTISKAVADSNSWRNLPWTCSNSVDTFFVISGLLVSYKLLCELQRNSGKLNIISIYLHRYLRLTPTLAFILSFMATLVVYSGSGPYWDTMTIISAKCRANWWTNLLYINNIVRYEPHAFVHNSVCMRETWYLAIDMQYFLISPLLIYPIWRWGAAGLAPLFALMSASLMTTVNAYASNNVIMYPLPRDWLLDNRARVAEYYRLIYTKPLIRIGPYLVGILLGWCLFETKKTGYKMSKKVACLLWAISTVVFLAILFGPYPYFAELRQASKLEVVLIGSLHRTLWALAVSWLIYACMFGYAGPINDLLSCNIFIPGARLNYCVFLININYISYYAASSHVAQYYTPLSQCQYVFGVILMVYVLALVTSVAVEVPCDNLQRLVFRHRKSIASEKRE